MNASGNFQFDLLTFERLFQLCNIVIFLEDVLALGTVKILSLSRKCRIMQGSQTVKIFSKLWNNCNYRFCFEKTVVKYNVLTGTETVSFWANMFSRKWKKLPIKREYFFCRKKLNVVASRFPGKYYDLKTKRELFENFICLKLKFPFFKIHKLLLY